MNTTTAINAYKNVKVESGVNGADPLKLIVMLYQGALLAISSAKNQMQRKEIAAKGESIGKAIRIIDEGLKCSLDMNVNGELVHNLAALYDYMNQRLVLANLKNDPAILDEVSGLLSELKGAWEAIQPGAQNASTYETLSTSGAASTGITNSSVPQSAIGKQAARMYGRM